MSPDPQHQLEFEIITKLGGGGMAEVFLGRSKAESGFEKLVAIKKVHPFMARKESFIKMLLDEARVAAILNHINIAQIVDLRRADDFYYIIMEYVHGVSLYRVNQHFEERSIPAPAPMVAYLMVNLCAGLEHAHSRCDQQGRHLGIIHRDVSPDNVMVSFEGEVKLIDFGVVRAAQRLHETMGVQIKGKPIYMSPEQASGGPLDHRADIYSAGVVLYELLTLQNPLMGTDRYDHIRRAMHPSFPSPSDLYPDVDPELERICIKALAADPEQRYPSAAVMEHEVEQFLRKHPYSRQQLADWVKETFKAEQARLRQVISGEDASSEDIRPPRRAGDGTNVLATPAGYRGALRVIRTAPVFLGADDSGDLQDSTRQEPVSERQLAEAPTVTGDGEGEVGPEALTVTGDGDVNLAATTVADASDRHQLPNRAAKIHAVETVVEREDPPFHAHRSTRRRTWVPLLVVGAVTVILAVLLFMAIQAPEPLSSETPKLPGSIVDTRGPDPLVQTRLDAGGRSVRRTASPMDAGTSDYISYASGGGSIDQGTPLSPVVKAPPVTRRGRRATRWRRKRARRRGRKRGRASRPAKERSRGTRRGTSKASKLPFEDL